MNRRPAPIRAWTRTAPLAALVLWFVCLWAPLARACPACAAGDTSATVGDGWMIALLSLPIMLGAAAGLVAWRLAAAEDRRK